MIKIRLQRHGARHAPFYRMVVAPSTARRDGKFIEVWEHTTHKLMSVQKN